MWKTVTGKSTEKIMQDIGNAREDVTLIFLTL